MVIFAPDQRDAARVGTLGALKALVRQNWLLSCAHVFLTLALSQT